MLDQAESLRRLMNNESHVNISNNKPKIITVTSGKGGVGKSNFVVNLGIELQKHGKKVLIFDADIGMGNDDVLMGVYPRYSMFDVIKGKEISDIIEDGPYGIKLLAAGSGINQIEDLQQYERELFLSKLESLEGFDYILMDTGAGVSRDILSFISASEELIIITTPEPTSLTDAYSLIKATDYFKLKNKAKIIVNKAFTRKEGEDTYKKLKKAVDKFLKIEVEYLGSILDDKKLVMSVRAQKPFVLLYPNCIAARDIENITSKIMEQEIESSEGAIGLFKKLFNIFS